MAIDPGFDHRETEVVHDARVTTDFDVDPVDATDLGAGRV